MCVCLCFTLIPPDNWPRLFYRTRFVASVRCKSLRWLRQDLTYRVRALPVQRRAPRPSECRFAVPGSIWQPHKFPTGVQKKNCVQIAFRVKAVSLSLSHTHNVPLYAEASRTRMQYWVMPQFHSCSLFTYWFTNRMFLNYRNTYTFECLCEFSVVYYMSQFIDITTVSSWSICFCLSVVIFNL